MKRLILCLFALLIVSPNVALAQTGGGIALEYDSSTVLTIEAGTTLQFDLVARDTSLNIIETWDAIGQNAVLTVRGSNAETDSSTRSWSADPLGYSWLELRLNGAVLALDSTGAEQGDVLLHYTIPTSAFSLGKTALSFTQSGADMAVSVSITPRVTHLGQQSPPITIVPGPHDNYLVELTRPLQGEDKVFLLRRYEIVVAPRDRYLNVISGGNVATSFSAAFPTEFVNNMPGVTNIFGGTLYINGLTNYFLTSRLRRLDSQGEVRQVLMAHETSDSMIFGQTDPFEILDHAPLPVTLQQPPDSTVLYLLSGSNKETFSWGRSMPQDPYTDIRLSRFNPATYSDIVLYNITFVDEFTLTRSIVFDADSSGLAETFSTNHGQLENFIPLISGNPRAVQQDLVWFVTARDYDDSFGLMIGPLYETRSSPPNLEPQSPPGFRLTLIRFRTHVDPAPNPGVFFLHQNYPNPFSPSTAIRVDLPSPAHCRLQVYNIVGEEVALLHQGKLDAGSYNFQFHGDELPPGLYTYRLVVDDAVHARNMLLLR